MFSACAPVRACVRACVRILTRFVHPGTGTLLQACHRLPVAYSVTVQSRFYSEIKTKSTFDVYVLCTVGRIPSRVTCFIRHRPMTNRERPVAADSAHWPPRDLARVVAGRRLTNGVVQRHADVIPAGYCDVYVRRTRDFRRLHVCVEKCTKLHAITQHTN